MGLFAGSNCKWPLLTKFNLLFWARSLERCCYFVLNVFSFITFDCSELLMICRHTKSQRLLNALHFISNRVQFFFVVVQYVNSPNFTQLRQFDEKKIRKQRNYRVQSQKIFNNVIVSSLYANGAFLHVISKFKLLILSRTRWKLFYWYNYIFSFWTMANFYFLHTCALRLPLL